MRSPEGRRIGKARYLAIYVAGLHQRFHRVNNPKAPGETFAESMFTVLEGFAASTKGCVGLYLWVRADNERAIGFYKKVGFVEDPAGPVQRDEETPHLTMRKVFELPG